MPPYPLLFDTVDTPEPWMPEISTQGAPLIHLHTTISLQGCGIKSPARNASYIGLLPWWPTSCQDLSTNMLYVPLHITFNIAFKPHLRKTWGNWQQQWVNHAGLTTTSVHTSCNWFFPSCLGVYQASTKLLSWTMFLLFLWYLSLMVETSSLSDPIMCEKL